MSYTLGYARWALDEIAAPINACGAVRAHGRRSPHTTKPGFDHAPFDGAVEPLRSPIGRAQPVLFGDRDGRLRVFG
jgi:hypothetical protein